MIYTCVIEKTDKAGQLLPKILEQILELGPIKSVRHGTQQLDWYASDLQTVCPDQTD